MENPIYHEEWQRAVDNVEKTPEACVLLQKVQDEFQSELAAKICGGSLLSKQYRILKEHGHIK